MNYRNSALNNILAVSNAQTVEELDRILFFNTDEGLTVNWDTLRQSLLDAGHPESCLPPPLNKSRALSRAVTCYRSKRVAIDRLQSDYFGYQVTDKTADSSTSLGYQPKFSVYIDKQLPGLQFSGDQGFLADEILATYKRNLEEGNLTMIKTWLTTRLISEGATKIMDKGYAFFCPRETYVTMEPWLDVIEEKTPIFISSIPVGTADQLSELILRSLNKETEALLFKVKEVVTSDDPGKRALKNRYEDLEAHITRLKGYADLLGESMDDVTQRLRDSQKQVNRLITFYGDAIGVD